MNFQNLLLVGIGGFFGSIARFVLAKTIDESLNRIISYGTLTVNVLGALLLGGIYAYSLSLKKEGFSEAIALFWGVGFCGGFTTFSTFAWQNLQLLGQKNIPEAILYILLSLVLSILAVWVGFALIRNL